MKIEEEALVEKPIQNRGEAFEAVSKFIQPYLI